MAVSLEFEVKSSSYFVLKMYLDPYWTQGFVIVTLDKNSLRTMFAHLKVDRNLEPNFGKPATHSGLDLFPYKSQVYINQT